MLPAWVWTAWAVVTLGTAAASFGVLEGLALRGRGTTLSTRTRRFFGVHSPDARRRRVGTASFLSALVSFAAFLAWFGWHIVAG